MKCVYADLSRIQWHCLSEGSPCDDGFASIPGLAHVTTVRLKLPYTPNQSSYTAITDLRGSPPAGSTDVERRCVASEAPLSADAAAGMGTPSFLAAAATALDSHRMDQHRPC